MKTFFKSNIAKISALLLLGVLSFCWAAPFMTQPEIYQRSIDSLQAKQETVLELTAASTAASAAITLLPGDTATPIADKLADLSGYFLIVLCAIFLEKYLLTITAGAAFRLLFPLACLLLIAYVFRGRKLFAMLAVKLICFGVAIMLIIPASVYVSDTIENTYSASINAAIESAKTTVKEAEAAESAASGQEETTGLSGLLSKVTDGISKAAAETVGRFKQVLNNLIEALAVMLVTSCLIPILVILFFLWLVKLITGVSIQLPGRGSAGKVHPLTSPDDCGEAD